MKRLFSELCWMKTLRGSRTSHIASKISKSVGIILRSSLYLFKSSLKTLYYGLVYPYLQYCNVVWASTYQSNLNRIVILQKRIVRIISKVKFDSHTDPLYKELNILKFHDICNYRWVSFYSLGKITVCQIILMICLP